MQQSGDYRISAPVSAVWRALNDPSVLARCIDGCQSMERVGEDAYRATVKAKVGPVSAPFTADVTLTDVVPERTYTLRVDVKGGAAGFGKGAATVTLVDEGPATLLRYDVQGSVGGKLAQVGQRLIDGAARKMADDFFEKFSEAVAPSADQAAPPPAKPTPASQAARISPVRLLMIAVAVGAAVIAAILLSR
jgi:carbon monoxide dehydrogenase subunit G